MDAMSEPGWRRRRREAILRAAAELFRHAAFERVQMDDVARAAGVGKATLYRYYPSKEDLYLESFDASLVALEARLAGAAAAPLPPTEQLAAMIAALVETLSDELASLRLLTGNQPALAERWRAVLRAHRQRITAALRGTLERGTASGEFRALDLDVVPGILVGMIRGGLMGAAGLPRERVGSAALDLVLQGSLAGARRETAPALPQAAQ